MEEGMTHVNLPFPDKVIPAPYAGEMMYTKLMAVCFEGSVIVIVGMKHMYLFTANFRKLF